MLSSRQIEDYKTNGYVVVKDIIPYDHLKELKDVLAQILGDAKGLEDHNEIYDLEPAHTPEKPLVRRVKTPHKWHPIFDDTVRLPDIVSVLRDLIGENVRLHGSKINIKAPHLGSPVEWHQDWAFYPHTNDNILAICIMLDDVEIDNGPMLAIPGSHRIKKVWDHHLDGHFCGAIDPSKANDIDFSNAIPCVGKAGSASFHHVRLVHGSAQNRSNKPRNLLLYECADSDAWPLLNFQDLDEYNSRMISGAPSIAPRTDSVPIRMPLPPAHGQGSIYENQKSVTKRYFESG